MPRGAEFTTLAFAFIYVVCAASAFALDPNTLLSQYGRSVWRVQDGALIGSPTALAQTADGFMWVGTPRGLYQFDGVSFTAWNPPVGQLDAPLTDSIASLLAARDGSLWIGTDRRLFHWADGRLSPIAGGPARVDAIAEDRAGAIWFTRSHQREFTGPICRVVGGNQKCFGEPAGLKNAAAGPIAGDLKGQFWIGGSSSIIAWNGKLIGEYVLPQATSSDTSRGVEGIAAAPDGTVWVGVSRAGLHDGLQRFVKGTWLPFTAPGFDGRRVGVNTLFMDREGSLWVGTTNRGVYRIRGQSADHFGREDGLSGNAVYRIYEDHEGGIWISTGEGLDHFRDLAILHYAEAEGLSTETVAAIVARRDGSVTVASTSSLESISGSVVRPLKPGLPSPALLEDSSGNLWIARGEGGLAVQIAGRLVVIFKDDSKSIVTSLTEDASHAVWANVAGPHPRIVRVENFKVSQEFRAPEIGPAFFVSADSRGGIWAGLFDGNLAHFHDGRWDGLSMQPLVRRYAHVGTIFNMFIDLDGTLWAAATEGVVAYRNGNLQLLGQRNGLPCSSIYSTVRDGHNDLWILAQCGLTRVRNSELNRWLASPESKVETMTFTAIDGFRPGIPYSHPSLIRATDGKIWFENRSVLMTINPENLVRNPVLPPVHIGKIVADGREYQPQRGLGLPARIRSLQIDYSGLSFVAPSQVHFRYRLDNYDTGWQEAGTRRSAFYNDLPPGAYTFHVIASNNSGLWNTTGASLRFSIAPAYYQRFWFRALGAVSFIASLWALYRFRLRQLRREFSIALDARVNERTRIARELHDTLLQSLYGLMFKIQAGRRMLPRRTEDAMQILDTAIEETEQAIGESRDAILELRAQPISVSNLESLLESGSAELSAGECGGGKPSSFRSIVEGVPRTLSAATRDEIYRIALEALRNAYRHAEANQIEAEIQYGRDHLRVRIRDDGRGIDPAILEGPGRPGHWGLPGLRERAKRIGSQASVWSRPGAGTEIQLMVPAASAYDGATAWRWSRSRVKVEK